MATHLARLAEAAQERLGDYPSLYFEGTWHGSADLHERGARVAGGLRALGLAPGDRVVVVMANCTEVPVVYQAIWRAGCVVTPVVFLVTAPELRHIVTDSGAATVVTTPELLPKVAEAAVDGVHVLVVGQDSFGALEAAAPSSIVDRADDDLAALLYTGGTTGRSKGVALSHANLWHAGWSSRQVSYLPGVVRGIGALPLSHSYGLLVTVGALHNVEPMSTVLLRWFDAETWLRLAAEHRSQAAAVVPSMIVMLMSQPLEEYDLGGLTHVYSGAAPLAAAVARGFERRVPSARVLEGYGCTETAGIVSSTPPEDIRPGTVGRAVPNVEIRIETDLGAGAATGEDGEILVRGPNVMGGYWGEDSGRDDGSFEESPGGRWFRTGDIGRLDADGYLTIVDRKKDLIIRGGYNIYPRDVEDVLQQHPAVAMAAVVGRPDDRLGEEVVAFVSLRPGAEADEETLRAFTRERLAATKYPREIKILEAIPLTSVGKLDRKRLRASIREQSPTG